MRIVQQVAVLFYSPFPALCAPKIAGLLPASVPTRIDSSQLVIDFSPPSPYLTREELPPEFASFRTKEEMDAELAPFASAAYESLSRLYEFRTARSRHS